MDVVNAAGMDETDGAYVDDGSFDRHDYDDTEHDTDDDMDDDTHDYTNDSTEDDADDGGFSMKKFPGLQTIGSSLKNYPGYRGRGLRIMD